MEPFAGHPPRGRVIQKTIPSRDSDSASRNHAGLCFGRPLVHALIIQQAITSASHNVDKPIVQRPAFAALLRLP